MKKSQRGFTLIEILIVVVILAVLAAMVLPRMVIQTENGYIAEAQNITGALRSAEATAVDAGNLTGGWSAYNNAAITAAIPAINWKGVTSTNWSYAVGAGANNVVATRQGGNYSGYTVTLTEAGAFSCTGAKYTLISATQGCRVSGSAAIIILD